MSQLPLVMSVVCMIRDFLNWEKIMENSKANTRVTTAVTPSTTPPTSDPTTEDLRKALNLAYLERSELLLFIAKVLPAHLSYDQEAEEGFKGLLCVHGPTGQMAWHLADADRKKFDGLPFELPHYDGHSTEQKYLRLREITPDDFSTIIARDPKYGTILRFFCPMRVKLLTIDEFDKLYPVGGGNPHGDS